MLLVRTIQRNRTRRQGKEEKQQPREPKHTHIHTNKPTTRLNNEVWHKIGGADGQATDDERKRGNYKR